MSFYLIAQLRFKDVDAYRRYQRAFPEVAARFRMRVIAADEAPEVLEGDWPHDKIVVLAFPDEAEARAFVSDPGYLDISRDRNIGADTVAILVRGL